MSISSRMAMATRSLGICCRILAIYTIRLARWRDWLRVRMTQKWTSSVAGAHFRFTLRLALMVSMLCRATCVVTIRNWTASTTITVTPSPGGATDELESNEWMQYTCTSNGRSGMFTMANHKDDNVITILLYDGQIVALVDNISDSIDGLLVDEKGYRMQTLFINL